MFRIGSRDECTFACKKERVFKTHRRLASHRPALARGNVAPEHLGRGRRYLSCKTQKQNKGKRLESRCLSATEVTASRSGLLSHHCRWCSVLPALLPAWAGSRVTTCQAALTYARASLQTTCLAGASHPHGNQDVSRATSLHQSSPHAGHRKA